MFSIRYICESDKPFWFKLDKELREGEFDLKIRDKRGYVIFDNNKPAGVMRYNLMYDTIPFLTLLYIEDTNRGKGIGKQALLHWEEEMRALGYRMVMTSTRVDEQGQQFYRKMGYLDRGGLFLDGTPFSQPQEMFMIKIL